MTAWPCFTNPAPRVLATSPEPMTPIFMWTSATLMNATRALDDPAVDVSKCVRHDERVRVERAHDRLHFADFEPRDDAVHHFLIGVRQPAAGAVNRHAPL